MVVFAAIRNRWGASVKRYENIRPSEMSNAPLLFQGGVTLLRL
jgi:hypothetical protein